MTSNISKNQKNLYLQEYKINALILDWTETMLFFGCSDAIIRMLKIDKNLFKQTKELKFLGHENQVESLTWCNVDKYKFASIDEGGDIMFWSTEKLNPVHTIRCNSKNNIISFNSNGSLFSVCCSLISDTSVSKRINLYKYKNYKLIHSINLKHKAQCFSWLKDQNHFSYISNGCLFFCELIISKKSDIFSVKTINSIQICSAYSTSSFLNFSLEKNMIMIGSSDSSIVLIDCVNHYPIDTIYPFNSSIKSASLISNTNYALISSSDSYFNLVDYVTNENIAVVPLNGVIKCIATGINKNFLVASYDVKYGSNKKPYSLTIIDFDSLIRKINK